ncbi:hypothetical protein FKW77_002977 [Venturia effusa]|uniref:Uncharacterized protein n=1 Tax=Venturia effusa TaxID=50376 RepID=A0A517LMF9_9PEZI|nr:hypothetical protein FKW77_002977 [Venturia effusa]
MANSASHDIKDILKAISSSSPSARPTQPKGEPEARNGPSIKTDDSLIATIDTMITNMQAFSFSSLSSTILNRQLGMFSHTAAELRNRLYDMIAEDATYALNGEEMMSQLTMGQSNPPNLIKASPQIEREFAERLKKSAWPTILIEMKMESTEKATAGILDLIEKHCSDNGRLTKLAIIAQSPGGPRVEIIRITSILINLLSPEALPVQNNNTSDLVKLRIIVYINNWETIHRLQEPHNAIDWLLRNAWMDNHAALGLLVPRATRYPALQELEIGFRYTSPWGNEEYTFHYTKTQTHGVQCDTVFIPAGYDPVTANLPLQHEGEMDRHLFVENTVLV